MHLYFTSQRREQFSTQAHRTPHPPPHSTSSSSPSRSRCHVAVVETPHSTKGSPSRSRGLVSVVTHSTKGSPSRSRGLVSVVTHSTKGSPSRSRGLVSVVAHSTTGPENTRKRSPRCALPCSTATAARVLNHRAPPCIPVPAVPVTLPRLCSKPHDGPRCRPHNAALAVTHTAGAAQLTDPVGMPPNWLAQLRCDRLVVRTHSRASGHRGHSRRFPAMPEAAPPTQRLHYTRACHPSTPHTLTELAKPVEMPRLCCNTHHRTRPHRAGHAGREALSLL